MKDSSNAKKRPKRGGCNFYYAFPVFFGIFMWYFVSQGLWTHFKRVPIPSNTKEPEDESLLAFENPDTENDQIPSPNKKTLRKSFLANLNETVALKTYRRYFSSEEHIYREIIIRIEYLIETSQFKDATMELKYLGGLIPNSPRFLFTSAMLIDKISEYETSNVKLKQCIEIYKKLINLPKINPSLLYVAGKRLINRLQFLGRPKDAIIQSEILSNKIPQNMNLLNDLGIALLVYNRPSLAKEQFEKVLKMTDDKNVVALCHYAFVLKTAENRLNESVEYFTKCFQIMDESVMDARFFYQFGDALQRLGRTEEAYGYYQIGVDKGLFRSVYQRSIYNVENLEAKPWWTLEETTYASDLKNLEDNWKEIRNEALSQMNKRSGLFVTEEENLRDKGDWKQLNLYISGQKVEKNCEKCPYTCFLIDKIRAASTCTRGQVKFSLMKPGVHVWPHCGPTNCRLRAHLGLKIPVGGSIRVETEEKIWQEGKILVFDDSFEHEVWHNGTEFRLVLIIDVWHPGLEDYQKEKLSPL